MDVVSSVKGTYSIINCDGFVHRAEGKGEREKKRMKQHEDTPNNTGFCTAEPRSLAEKLKQSMSPPSGSTEVLRGYSSACDVESIFHINFFLLNRLNVDEKLFEIKRQM